PVFFLVCTRKSISNTNDPRKIKLSYGHRKARVLRDDAIAPAPVICYPWGDNASQHWGTRIPRSPALAFVFTLFLDVRPWLPSPYTPSGQLVSLGTYPTGQPHWEQMTLPLVGFFCLGELH